METVMEILKDLSPATLIIIVFLLVLLIGSLFKLIIYFAKNTSEKIVANISSDIQAISHKLDLTNSELKLNTIKIDAMHLSIGELFNGEYASIFEKRRTELMQNAVFLRQNIG